ncbi:M50 family metallopeptidase [Olleya sp. YS]|uniref:M50 family metallopeptidase n=1 Tax=Olleya sp. YS TaxID=3028318 RepID=UPI0024345240|nr:M50 family metallopeptidase [Olleya sp. YS]WGD34200.1 M50 family metallopeptidase [Olleya sp. YS]
MKLTAGKQQILYLVILLTTTILFWNTLLIYPIKLFVVMLHEMSHGLMAMLFGGDIIEIHIDRRIGGYCMYTMRPSFWGSFMTSSAGYLGSLFWGSLILILAVKLEKDKYITLAIGVLLLILSYFVLQSGVWFGTFMTIGLGAFMLVAFRFFGPLFHDLWLKFIGIICCAYVILDIKGDLIDNSNIGSDADKIAELTGIPSVLVGITWLIIALITLFFVLRYVYRLTKNSF